VNLSQPKTTCWVEQTTKPVILTPMSEPMISYYGRSLHSNCFFVVEMFQPVYNDYLAQIGNPFDGYVGIVGPVLPGYLDSGQYQLVRYQLVADCKQAVAVANEMLRQMRELDVVTPQYGSLALSRGCP
jgi:hypothetical protein